jgi:hypothetical protein
MTPTFLHPPKNYTQQEFLEFVEALDFSAWAPKRIWLHNTAAPTLAEWTAAGDGPSRETRIVTLDEIYQNADHWHAGPLLFIGPYADDIWNPCTIFEPGVAQSCDNEWGFPIEMIGNYATPLEQSQTTDPPPVDDWTSALAQAVKANTVFAAAVMYRKFGLWPDGFVQGVSGLQFHRYCVQDRHACPGGQVDHADMTACILAKMAELGATS